MKTNGRNRCYPMALGACAVALITGCASTGTGQIALDERNTKIEPVYRIQQPAGTAAGQYAIGRMDLAEGRIDAAIERFRNALKLDPVYAEAHNGLGIAYGQRGRFGEAAEAFRAALASGPASAHVLNNLGFAQLKAGRLAEAWKALERSFAIDPTNRHTRENLRLLAQLQLAAMPVARVAAAESEGAVSPTSVVVKPISVPAAVQPVASVPAPDALTPSPSPSTREVVLSRSGGTSLVQLSANVYELRPASANEGAMHSQFVASSGLAHVPSKPRVPASVSVATAPPVATSTQVPAVPRVATSVPVAMFPRVEKAVLGQRPVQTSLAALDRFEVSNGAGIHRLAGRTARELSRAGAGVMRVSNYASFDRVRTEIHYRAGFMEEAKLVRNALPVDAVLVRTRNLHPDVNVRLVLGRDMATGRIVWATTEDEESTIVARADAPEDGWRHL
jgi:hypothetical protein